MLAVELEGALDAAARAELAGKFGRWLAADARASARLARRFGFGPLALAARRSMALPFVDSTNVSGGSGGSREAGGTSGLVELARRRLLEPLDPTRDPLVDLHVESSSAVSRVALRWWHPVMDERGGELLLRALSEEARADGTSAIASLPPPPAARRHGRWRAFRNARRRLEELTGRPPFVLGPRGDPRESGPRRDARASELRGDASANKPRSWSLESDLLTAEETSRFLTLADERCGLRGEGLAQVALLFSALADVAPDDAELALPVTVQLRPPRARGPLCSNELSFLWYALPASLARDRAGCAEALRADAKAKVLADEAGEASALLEIGRCLPLPLYRRELARRGGASRFSASLSTLGELFAGSRTLFGRPLRDALALTAFPDPPGVGVVFSRAAGRLRITTLHAATSVDAVAARLFHGRLLAAARDAAPAR